MPQWLGPYRRNGLHWYGFQSILGAAVSPGTWRNLRFRIGGITLTAEANLAAAEDTDIIVGSVLRGGGRGSAKGESGERYDGSNAGPGEGRDYPPMQGGKGYGHDPHQGKGAPLGTQKEMQAALQRLMWMLEQANHAPDERQGEATPGWGSGDWQMTSPNRGHRPQAHAEGEGGAAWDSRQGWTAAAQDATRHPYTHAQEVPWGRRPWSESMWAESPWPGPEYAGTAGSWEATAASATWAEGDDGMRTAHA